MAVFAIGTHVRVLIYVGVNSNVWRTGVVLGYTSWLWFQYTIIKFDDDGSVSNVANSAVYAW